jgi:hypothetical protein
MADYVSISFLKAAPNTSVADDEDEATETFTPLVTNIVSTVAANGDLCILRIATTKDILVSLANVPDALTDPGRFLLPAGQTEWRSVRAGRKVGVALA